MESELPSELNWTQPSLESNWTVIWTELNCTVTSTDLNRYPNWIELPSVLNWSFIWTELAFELNRIATTIERNCQSHFRWQRKFTSEGKSKQMTVQFNDGNSIQCRWGWVQFRWRFISIRMKFTFDSVQVTLHPTSYDSSIQFRSQFNSILTKVQFDSGDSSIRIAWRFSPLQMTIHIPFRWQFKCCSDWNSIQSWWRFNSVQMEVSSNADDVQFSFRWQCKFNSEDNSSHRAIQFDSDDDFSSDCN